MKRNPRTSNHYDENLIPIDEQICCLLKQRKDLSDNAGIPSDDLISKWAVKYELYEDLLYQLFGTLRYESLFKPRIEPIGFRKYLSVLKSVEIGDCLYSVTVIRQYENASFLQLHVDWDGTKDLQIDSQNKNYFELFLGKEYDCRQERAKGSTGHYTYDFIISPPLPDEISGIALVFKEYSDTFKEKPTGFEIIMKLD